MAVVYFLMTRNDSFNPEVDSLLSVGADLIMAHRVGRKMTPGGVGGFA